MIETLRACPCCGYRTLTDPNPGSFEVCPICYWEDDSIQFADPTYRGGANVPSLHEARLNFVRFGACDESAISHVRRPMASDTRDSRWSAPTDA